MRQTRRNGPGASPMQCVGATGSPDAGMDPCPGHRRRPCCRLPRTRGETSGQRRALCSGETGPRHDRNRARAAGASPPPGPSTSDTHRASARPTAAGGTRHGAVEDHVPRLRQRRSGVDAAVLPDRPRRRMPARRRQKPERPRGATTGQIGEVAQAASPSAATHAHCAAHRTGR